MDIRFHVPAALLGHCSGEHHRHSADPVGERDSVSSGPSERVSEDGATSEGAVGSWGGVWPWKDDKTLVISFGCGLGPRRWSE